jgi:hypothetical protein
MHRFLHVFADPKNTWLAGVFAAFLLLICIFAVAYHLLYRRRRTHFLFNADILKNQKNIVADDLQRRYPNSGIQLTLIDEALQYIQGRIHHLANDDTQSIDLKSGRIVLVRTRLPATEPPEPYATEDALCSAAFHAHGGHAVGTRAVRNWDSASAEELFQDVRRRVTDELQSVQAQLKTFETDFPNIWSFWDFFYFSTITQTTVGYGDILPNSTLIRMIVCLQIVLGYGLLVVILNLALTHA